VFSGCPALGSALALSLSVLALWSALQGLVEMAPALEVPLAAGFLLGGLLLGRVLAAFRRLSGGWAAVWLGGAGLAALLLVPARLSGPFLRLQSAGQGWLAERGLALVLWALGRLDPVAPTTASSSPFWPALQAAWSETAAGLAALLQRVGAWGQALAAGRPVFDPLVAGLAWCALAWALAAWAGWWLGRGRPLAGFAPAGVCLAAGLYETGAAPDALLRFCAAVLAVHVITAGRRKRMGWRAARLPVVENTFEWAGMSLAVWAGLVLIAAAAPSISVREVARAVDRLVHPLDARGPDYAASLGVERQPAPAPVFEDALAASLPARHLIGSGRELSREVVLWVSLRGYTSVSPQALEANPLLRPPRYYARGLTFDRYTGRGWLSSPVTYQVYRAGEAIQGIGGGPGREVVQRVRFAGGAGELVYAAGDLLALDQGAAAAWRGGGDSPGGDLLGARVQGGAYEALSWQPAAGPQALRAAGQRYPEWLAQRYLALPDDLPTRVRRLALDLTAGQPTPYDRALAIETYLRAFPYSTDLPRPPFDADVVDHFLFELRTGYCDYYASAMVVLARAAGIPARLATGYVADNYDPTQARFVITRADAHSWPEVFFPGIGWVGFEPTARLTLSEGAQGGPPVTAPPVEAGLPPPAPPPARRAPGIPAWVWAVGLLALLPGLGLWLEGARLARLAPAAAFETMYRRLCRAAGRMGLAAPPGTTPLEFADLFHGFTESHFAPGFIAGWRAKAAGDVSRLVELYNQALYSRVPPAPDQQRQAARAWQRVLGLCFVSRVLLINKKKGTFQ
jgi:transglutaminase-like putative cysteine protease